MKKLHTLGAGGGGRGRVAGPWRLRHQGRHRNRCVRKSPGCARRSSSVDAKATRAEANSQRAAADAAQAEAAASAASQKADQIFRAGLRK